MQNIQRIQSYEVGTLDESIKNDVIYHLMADNRTPVAQKYGRDWIADTNIKSRKINGKKIYSWVDILNSGTLPNPGTNYKIFATISGKSSPELVFQGRAGYNGELKENTLSDQPNQIIPQPYNTINERTNMRMLADSIQFQSNQTIQTLQDELQRRDEFMKELQAESSQVYSKINERESEFNKEREILMNKNYEQLKEIEALKRELEISKLRFELEKSALEKEMKLERKLERMENEQKNKTDWGATLKDFMQSPMLQGIVAKKMGVQTAPTPGLASIPDLDFEEDNDED